MDTPQAPTYLTAYTLKQFLFSKAIVRTWAIGYAAVSYTHGLMAYMQQRPAYGNSSIFTTIAIGAYPDTNPFNVSKVLEMINTQYGVLCSLNGPEAFTHYGRIGFPAITPKLFPGRDLQTEPFIRRLVYPDSEINVNSENVKPAIKRQGADVMDNRELRIKAYSMK